MLRDLAPHLVIILVCCSILALSVILTPVEEGEPFLKLGKIPVPHSCMFKNLTGYPCPGCGLSRSLVSVLHGDPAAGFTYHRLGLITLFYIVLQLLTRMSFIIFPSTRIRFARAGRYLDRGIIFLGVLFGLNWIITLIILF